MRVKACERDPSSEHCFVFQSIKEKNRLELKRERDEWIKRATWDLYFKTISGELELGSLWCLYIFNLMMLMKVYNTCFCTFFSHSLFVLTWRHMSCLEWPLGSSFTLIFAIAIMYPESTLRIEKEQQKTRRKRVELIFSWCGLSWMEYLCM